MQRRASSLFMVALTALLVVALPARAADYPTRPIKLVVPYAAGGPTDVLGRVVGEYLGRDLKQVVVVENKAGAQGAIGAEAVARSDPDGYTLFVTAASIFVLNPLLYKKLPYDPARDFRLLSVITDAPMIMEVNPSAPFSNVREFVAYAKAHRGISYGTWGNGSNAHLFGELLARQAGIDLIHVPYKAEAAAHNDLFGEALGVAWANPATARGLAQAGRIKVLGITGRRRVRSMPEVPTFAEQGFAGFDLDSWIGVYAPAKTPQPVLDEWVAALQAVTRQPDVQERLAGYGFEPLGSTPAEFRAGQKADFPRVADLIKAAGVTPE